VRDESVLRAEAGGGCIFGRSGGALVALAVDGFTTYAVSLSMCKET
jgi:hypothetical protein